MTRSQAGGIRGAPIPITQSFPRPYIFPNSQCDWSSEYANCMRSATAEATATQTIMWLTLCPL